MESHFIAYMYRLRYIERWSLMRNTTRENVAEHSYHVALLAHMLCEIGNRIYGRSLNADRAATLALFHDATEVFTGDIPTPVKHHNPRMLANFRELEGMAAERLLGMVPPPLQAAYEPLVCGTAAPASKLAAGAEESVRVQTAANQSGAGAGADDARNAQSAEHRSGTDAANSKSTGNRSGIGADHADEALPGADLTGAAADQDWELLRMLKAADLLDAYIKCLCELSSGNREFAVAKGQTEQALAKLEMPEVDWFLTHMAPSFSKTLDELSEEH